MAERRQGDSQIRSVGVSTPEKPANEKVSEMENQVKITKGSISKDHAFEVGGNKNSKEPKLAAMPLTKFKATIVFKDYEEMRDCAVKSVAIAAGAKIRKAVAEGKPLPYPVGRTFIMNARAETELSAQEKAEQAWQTLQNTPGAIDNLPKETIARMIEMLSNKLDSANPADDADAAEDDN